MALPALDEYAPTKADKRPLELVPPERALPQPHQWTVDEYFAILEASEEKLEYIDGTIYDMAGGTEAHDVITMNITGSWFNQLRGTDCALRSSNMQVRIEDRKYVFPDLSVVCGKALYDSNNVTLLNPIAVIEVTSPSSIKYDRTTKFDFYRALPSVQAYIVIDQHRVYVELHTRLDNGWMWQEFSDLADTIVVEPINCDLALADIYHNINLESA